jgi:hypothetical protein
LNQESPVSEKKGETTLPDVVSSTGSHRPITPGELREHALLRWSVIETLMEQCILHYFEIAPDRSDMFDILTDRLTARDKIDVLTSILAHSDEPVSGDKGLTDHLVQLREIVVALAHGYSLSEPVVGVFDIHATRYGRTREYELDAEEFLSELSAVGQQLASIVSFWKDRSAPFQEFLSSRQQSEPDGRS